MDGMDEIENATCVFLFWCTVYCMLCQMCKINWSLRLQHTSTCFLKMSVDTFCVISNSNNTCVFALMKR